MASIAAAVRAGAAGVELGHDLLEGHAALVERLAVEEDRRHGHDLAGVDLVLEQGAVDGDVGDARVQHAHEVERLHDVGAVLAGQREVGLEGEVALEVLDLLDGLGRGGRRVAAHLQEGEHQRRQLVAEGDAGEADLDVGADPTDGEGGAAIVVGAARR